MPCLRKLAEQLQQSDRKSSSISQNLGMSEETNWTDCFKTKPCWKEWRKDTTSKIKTVCERQTVTNTPPQVSVTPTNVNYLATMM